MERHPCQAQGETGDLPMPTAEDNAAKARDSCAPSSRSKTCDRKTPLGRRICASPRHLWPWRARLRQATTSRQGCVKEVAGGVARHQACATPQGLKACMMEISACLCSQGQRDLVSFAMTSEEQVKAKCGIYTRPLAWTSAKNCKPLSK